MLISGVWATTWSHIAVQGPCCHWGHVNLSGLCRHLGHGNIQTQDTLSGSMVLPQLGSVLKSVTHVTTDGHTEAWNLGFNLRPC